MNLQRNLASARGVAAIQNLHALFFHRQMAASGPKFSCTGRRSCFTFLFLLLFGSPIVALSQKTVTAPLSDYGLYIQAPNQQLNQGETATLTLKTTGSINRAVDLQIELILSPFAEAVDADDLDAAQSWYFPDTPLLAVHADTLRIRLPRNPAISGQGELLSIEVTARRNQVTAAELLRLSGGGSIVVVENIGFKQVVPPGNGGDGTVIFPNPARETLNFNFSGPAPTQARLYNAHGQEVARIPSGSLSTGTWNLPKLPPGRYFLIWTDPDQIRQRRSFLIQ